MRKGSIILAFLTLLSGSLAGVYWFTPIPNDADFAEEVSQALAGELAKADQEAVLLIQATVDDERWINASHSFFLIDDDSIVAWSKNDYVPKASVIHDDFSLRFVQNDKGNFIVKKWKKGDSTFLLLVLPLEFEYGITNDYLSPIRNPILPNHCDVTSNEAANGKCIKIDKQDCLFKITSNKGELFQDSAKAKFSLAIVILIAVFVFWIINHVILLKLRKWKYELIFLINLLMLLAFRISAVKMNFPRAFISVLFFDPTYYASSSFNVSIGDLLINSIVVFGLCLYLFFFYTRFQIIKLIPKLNWFMTFTLATFFVFTIYLALLFPYLYIESIYHNSSISLEITDSISFSAIRLTALLSIVIGCISSYLVIHIFLRLVLFLKMNSGLGAAISFLLGTLLFLLFFLWNEKDYRIVLIIGSGLLLILHFSKVVYHNQGISFKTYVYLLLVIIAFAIQCSLSAAKLNQEKKRESQFKFGNNYLVDQDILAEFLLHESSLAIAQDDEIRRLVKLANHTALIRERVTQYYLTSYFDRYEISVSSFAEDSTSAYIDRVKKMAVESNRSSFNDVYFINDPASDTLKRYIAMISIHTSIETRNEFIVLDLSLKKIIPETVFPELMVDNRYGQNFRDKEFSYALYTDEKIGSSFGNFNYDKFFDVTWLAQTQLYHEGLLDRGYRHVAIEYQPHRIAVITASVYPIEHVIINFSFYIALGLLVIMVLLLGKSLTSWINGQRLGYTSRVQLYVYLAFFIPLLIVSLVTLRLIIISAENQKEADYLSKAKILEERISPILDSYKLLGNDYKNQMEAKLIEIAEVAHLDASVFSKQGQVIASSEPLIFEDQLLSTIINRAAWHSIIVNHENYSVQSESIGKLFYNTVYWAIRSPVSGEVTAILSIPFFESASSLERTEINVVSAILGVFAIAFILFSLLSYFVINGLTAPLRFITHALRKISLSGKNVPIDWRGNDELAAMAQEYNRMLVNLEQSKVELQKSQKEIAWREVAQQVAHEIKNPLTPMKLSLQQLELGLSKGNLEKEKSQKSIGVALRQIEILSDIASSFSTFAKMPAPEIRKINVTTLLAKTIGLYSDQPHVSVIYQVEKNVFVIGDEAILLRAFSNIILNGIQSKNLERAVELNIGLQCRGDHCIVAFADNGNGIPEEVAERIFTPHFTTKSTGSGLGLAIVKQSLEICNSSIWFETRVGEGTTFYLQLPLADHD